MRNKVVIYLAGSIKKGHENANESYWTEEDRAFLKQALSPREASFLNPALRSDDLSDQHSVFGRDMLQVFCSDIVFVDARDRRGLGVGAEMMWAKFHKLPVITLAPKNTHYHKSNATVLGTQVKEWIHPFVESLSDVIVENLGEGALWIGRILSSTCTTIKGIEHIESAMHHYRETQLPVDAPMKELVTENYEMANKVNKLNIMNLMKENYFSKAHGT